MFKQDFKLSLQVSLLRICFRILGLLGVNLFLKSLFRIFSSSEYSAEI